MEYKRPSLYDLPEEIIISIFEYCDLQSLGRLAQTCKKFKHIIKCEDVLYQSSSRFAIGSNMLSPLMQRRCNPILSYKQRCQISRKWAKNLGKYTVIASYKRCMPWIYLEKEYFFCSKGDMIVRFARDNRGRALPNTKSPFKKAVPASDDISKFAVNATEVVCATRDGKLSRLGKNFLQRVHSVQAHDSDILSVDSKDDLIISGSKDFRIKIWKSHDDDTELQKEITVGIRVLSLSFMMSHPSFVVGLPGTRSIHPLQLFDVQRGSHITDFGKTFRNGAGIIDMYSESENTFFSCGYDATLQLWDIRDSNNRVALWTEPLDNCLYCVRTDHNVTMVTGAYRDGVVHIWDKRSTKAPVKIYYLDDNCRSPVYSLAFDAAHLYTALDNVTLQHSFI